MMADNNFIITINWPIHETKTKYGLVRLGPLFENGAPQRQAVGTFDVCLARPKVCPTDIVRPHAAQLMIDTSVNQFCKIWPGADWPQQLVSALKQKCNSQQGSYTDGMERSEFLKLSIYFA